MGRTSSGVTVRASQKPSGKSILGGPRLRQNCRITRRDARTTSSAVTPLRAERPGRTVASGLHVRPADEVVVAGGEVGVHERDRCQVLVTGGVLGAALDVVRHECHVAARHRRRQLLHLPMVDGDEVVVAPAPRQRLVLRRVRSRTPPNPEDRRCGHRARRPPPSRRSTVARGLRSSTSPCRTRRRTSERNRPCATRYAPLSLSDRVGHHGPSRQRRSCVAVCGRMVRRAFSSGIRSRRWG